MPEVLCCCTPMSAFVPKLVLAACMMGSSIMVVWEAYRKVAAATCCCGGRRCGDGSNSKINIRSFSSLLRSKALRIFALFIGWGSWWVYCSIEAISPPNVWIDFAEITLAKLCVQTCCTMRSHEDVDKLLPPPWVVILLPFHHLLLPGWGTWMDGWGDGWMERTTTQGYYISRLVGTRDFRALWSRLVFCFFLRNFGGNKTKQKHQSHHIYRICSWRSPKKTKQDLMKFLFSRLAFSQFSRSYDFLFFSFLFLFSKDFFLILFFLLLLSSNRFKPKILNK